MMEPTKTTTYEDLFAFARHAQDWLRAGEANPNTKLGYALKRMIERVERLTKKYNRKLQALNCKYCMTSEEPKDKGAVLENDRGGFRFTPAQLDKLNDEIEKLDESTVEIKTYLATDLTNVELSEIDRYHFEGFVLDPEPEPSQPGYVREAVRPVALSVGAIIEPGRLASASVPVELNEA